MCRDQMRGDGPNGFSLLECLVAVALLGILATLALPSPGALHRQLELDSALRRLRVGLDRGRMAAERDRQPCALQLTATGWSRPRRGDLPACRAASTALSEADSFADAGELELRSNLPDSVRFSVNGLVLDGGLVVLFHPSHAQALCLVIGLPLGISRRGVYRGDPRSSLNSSQCQPKDA